MWRLSRQTGSPPIWLELPQSSPVANDAVVKILISGVCGFVGSELAEALVDHASAREIVGFDNLSRAGSYLNVDRLRKRGVTVRHADVRSASDLEGFSSIDWIVDAAANPSVLAGIDGSTSSRQLL